MCSLGLSANSSRKSWPDGEGRSTSDKSLGMQCSRGDRNDGVGRGSAAGAALLQVQRGCFQLGLLETLGTSALSKLGQRNPRSPALLLGALPVKPPWEMTRVAVKAGGEVSLQLDGEKLLDKDRKLLPRVPCSLSLN